MAHGGFEQQGQPAGHESCSKQLSYCYDADVLALLPAGKLACLLQIQVKCLAGQADVAAAAVGCMLALLCMTLLTAAG
jgi:hypothetical protein